MARIRTIKPEFWTDEKITECSVNARLLFIGMWNFADDAGRLDGSAKRLRMQIYPGDDFSVADVQGMLAELSRNGLTKHYAVDGKEFIQITGWHHQKINRPQPSKIPAPTTENSVNVQCVVTDGRERKGREGKKDSIGRSDDATDEAFERFWKAYPSRGSSPNPKKPCRSKFAAAVKAGADPEAIIRGAERYAESMAGEPKRHLVCQALTFLSQDRWEQHAAPPDDERAPQDADGDRWRNRLRGWTENGFWLPDWGPEPGKPGCAAPTTLQADRRAA